MIDFEKWAKEEQEKAEDISGTLAGLTLPQPVSGIFDLRIEQHRERAKFLEKLASEGHRW